jgi:hypothetical protein
VAFIPQVLPASMPSLADRVPEAPAGTIFVKAAQGGFWRLRNEGRLPLLLDATLLPEDLHLLGEGETRG